jgi:hypothetical protein
MKNLDLNKFHLPQQFDCYNIHYYENEGNVSAVTKTAISEIDQKTLKELGWKRVNDEHYTKLILLDD